MKNRYITIITLFACCLASSCNDWLDVKPSDKVSEEDVFSDLNGFRTALNGIYIELNTNNLYGKSLTGEIIEVMAHRYYVNREWEEMMQLYNHDYKKKYAIDRFDNIWSSAYAQIAGINMIIRNCEAHKDVLTGINYNLIKGEALALRAFLHLDMFRLFGPVYKSDTTVVSLPYNTEFTFSAGELLPAHKFIRNVIADFSEAAGLLAVDPIIEKGPSGSADPNDPFRDRSTRMNYYAVQTLLARAALYAMDKPLALSAAKKVIAAQSRWFPFVKPENIKGNLENPDRILSTELLIALENPQRVNIYNTLFNPENVEAKTLLAPREEKIQYIFEGEEDRDYRSVSIFKQVKTMAGVNYRVFKKYADVSNKKLKLNTLIPLVRISEAYYVAAECELVPADGLVHLNIIRNNRGLESINNSAQLKNLLTTEYMREFFGEGQLFFYYKRLYMTAIINGDSPYGMVTQRMNSEKYVIPLPQSEIQYR